MNCLKQGQADQENVNNFNSTRGMPPKEPRLDLKPIKGMSFGKINQIQLRDKGGSFNARKANGDIKKASLERYRPSTNPLDCGKKKFEFQKKGFTPNFSTNDILALNGDPTTRNSQPFQLPPKNLGFPNCKQKLFKGENYGLPGAKASKLLEISGDCLPLKNSQPIVGSRDVRYKERIISPTRSVEINKHLEEYRFKGGNGSMRGDNMYFNNPVADGFGNLDLMIDSYHQKNGAGISEVKWNDGRGVKIPVIEGTLTGNKKGFLDGGLRGLYSKKQEIMTSGFGGGGISAQHTVYKTGANCNIQTIKLA